MCAPSYTPDNPFFSRRYLNTFKAEFAITLLALLCELEAASDKLSLSNPSAIRKVLTILSSGVSTGMDALTKHAKMTETSDKIDSDRLPEAYVHSHVFFLVVSHRS